MYRFARFVFDVSHKLGAGNLLYGGKALHDGGPWVHPDRWSRNAAASLRISSTCSFDESIGDAPADIEIESARYPAQFQATVNR